MELKSIAKKAWLLLICLAALSACSDDNKVEDENTITLPPKTEELFEKGLNFTDTESAQSFEFTASENWSITATETRNGEKWYRIFPTSGGPGKTDISIEVDENQDYDDRSVAITINAGKASKTMMISQKQKNALLLTSDRMEVKQQGGTVNLEVKANVSYQVVIAEECQSWIKPATTTRALATSTVSLNISPSEEQEKREGTVYITDGTLRETVKIYQHGGSIILLNQNEYPVSDQGDTIKVELRSNCNYSVKMANVDWIKEAVLTRGMSSHTAYYIISPNEMNESRRAQIIFYDKANTAIADTLTVIQAQKDAVIISNKSVELKSCNDTIFSIDVSSNVDLEVHPADTCQWITESIATRAMELRKISLKAVVNEGFAPRRGRVLIKSRNSNACDTLKIWQPGKRTQVGLETTELNVPIAGGTFRIKVNANVEVKTTRWSQLRPEGSQGDISSEITVERTRIFAYENKPELLYQASLSPDNQYLEVKVQPAVCSEEVSATVIIYGRHENREARLVIRQEPDPSKPLRIGLTEFGGQLFGDICTYSYQALQEMYTQEELYSRQGHTEQGYDWTTEFINHTLTSTNAKVERAWATPYAAINRALQMKRGILNSNHEDLLLSDLPTVIALLEMHRFMLYYEMTNLWGKAVYWNELPPNTNTSIPATPKDELLTIFVDPLTFAIEKLEPKKKEQTDINSIYFPSRDLPSLLLGRILMEKARFAEAKDRLTEIVHSGRYQSGDLIFRLPASLASGTPPETAIRFSYTEVLLGLAECEFRVNNYMRAEEYLNTVSPGNVGNPETFIKRLADAWKSNLKGTGTYFAFLKRNGIAEKTLNIPAWRLLFPIPMREVNMNPSMTQNPGY